MQRILSFLTGTLCGAACGAVAALLLAPSSGRDLQLRSRARAQLIATEVQQAYLLKQMDLQRELDYLKSPKLVTSIE